MSGASWQCVVVGSLACTTVHAQTVEAIVSAGDVVPGVGSVTRIDNLAVADDGTWRVEADTNAFDTDADSVLLLNGGLELREGQALGGGLVLDGFDAVNVPSDGVGGWNFFLSGTSDDSGLFHGTNLLLQEGDFSGSPAFSSFTPYTGFFETKAIPDEILAIASVNDPALPGTTNLALIRLRHDGAGTVLSEDVLLKQGDTPPLQSETVDGFETGPHQFAMNAAGRVLFTVDLSGPFATDHAVYLDATPIAQEGFPSGIPGRNWATLANAEVDLDDFGRWVLSGSLEGDSATNLAIVKNGVKLVQEGDTLPDIAPFVLESFGSGPVVLANNGDVLWYGNWSDPDGTRDQGLFVNDRLLVQEGVTQVGGMPITTLFGLVDAYTMSPNGRFILFEGQRGNVNEAYRIDRGGLLELETCTPNQGRLAHTAGVPGIGETFRVALDDGLAPVSAAFLAVSNTRILLSPDCGLALAFGELVISLSPPNPILFLGAPLWVPGSPSSVPITLPNDANLVGREFWLQGLFAQAGGVFRLTNALELSVGE